MEERQYDDWDLFYLGLAKYVSKKSKDPRTKVGAVLVRPDNTLASIGFNGFPKGMVDYPELYADRDQKLSRIVHAEINAREFANESVKGYTIYVWPFMPCDRCTVQLVQAGVSRFVYPEAPEEKLGNWKDVFERTVDFIDEAGRTRTQIPLSIAVGL